MKPSKEITKLIKRIEPDLDKLLKIIENPKDLDPVVVDCVRTGARSLIMARRVGRKG